MREWMEVRRGRGNVLEVCNVAISKSAKSQNRKNF